MTLEIQKETATVVAGSGTGAVAVQGTRETILKDGVVVSDKLSFQAASISTIPSGGVTSAPSGSSDSFTRKEESCCSFLTSYDRYNSDEMNESLRRSCWCAVLSFVLYLIGTIILVIVWGVSSFGTPSDRIWYIVLLLPIFCFTIIILSCCYITVNSKNTRVGDSGDTSPNSIVSGGSSSTGGSGSSTSTGGSGDSTGSDSSGKTEADVMGFLHCVRLLFLAEVIVLGLAITTGIMLILQRNYFTAGINLYLDYFKDDFRLEETYAVKTKNYSAPLFVLSGFVFVTIVIMAIIHFCGKEGEYNVIMNILLIGPVLISTCGLWAGISLGVMGIGRTATLFDKQFTSVWPYLVAASSCLIIFGVICLTVQKMTARIDNDEMKVIVTSNLAITMMITWAVFCVLHIIVLGVLSYGNFIGESELVNGCPSWAYFWDATCPFTHVCVDAETDKVDFSEIDFEEFNRTRKRSPCTYELYSRRCYSDNEGDPEKKIADCKVIMSSLAHYHNLKKQENTCMNVTSVVKVDELIRLMEEASENLRLGGFWASIWGIFL